MPDPVQDRLITREPCNRADRRRDKQETTAEPPLALRLPDRECSSDREPGKIIVRQAWMADMGGDQNFFRRLSRQKQFYVCQIAGPNIAVDVNAITFVTHHQPTIVRHAESPVVCEISGAVGGQIRLLRQGMDVPRQLLPAHHLVNRTAVANDMKVTGREIDNTPAIQRANRGATNIPFQRHLPVQNWGTTRNLFDGKRDMPAEDR